MILRPPRCTQSRSSAASDVYKRQQLKYYANQTDYSTITVSISQSSVGTFEPEEKWKPFGVLKDAIRALGEFGKGLVNFAIWLIVFGIPITFTVVLVIYLVKKARK